ncbi:hypothetical protein DL770_005175 [Monosporascus sp. CRB-9-2]|nr:hypothetical protein DL770_005175 [Monosporascus sp. CRB-9-2]
MSADGSTCPENENSTDCLLRALLKALDKQANAENGDFDWDPITFGFTVPIGIIAALFALVTVFQAVLAAGPGRRKSNRNAIGEWSQYTRRKWSWPDMTMLSIARTPILRTPRIITLLEAAKERVDEWAAEDFGNQNATDYEVAATWWSLLDEVDLRWLFRCDTYMLKTQCDYLPDDLRAAPAYAEVGCIVAMTAVAGAVSFKSEEQSAYPIIIGDGFQFDFRQHPTLGTVGAFSRHGDVYRGRRPVPIDMGRSLVPRLEQALLALRHAQGDVKGGFCGFHDGKFINAIRQTDPGTIIENRHSDRGCSAANRVALCQCNTLYDRPDDHHLLWLITAAVPEEVPVIFPSGSTISPNLTMLALNSRFWRAPRQTRLNETEPSILGQSQIKWYPTAKPHAVKDEHIRYISALLISTKERPLPKRPDGIDVGVENLDRDDIIVAYNDVFKACLRLLYSLEDFQSWFATLDDLTKQYLRILVLLQLRQVDKWFKWLPSRLIICKAVTLYLNTLTLLDAEAAITEDTFGFSLSQEGSGNQESATAGAPMGVVARHLTTIKTLFEFAGQYVDGLECYNTTRPIHVDITQLADRSNLGQFYCLAGRSPRFNEQLGDMGVLFGSILGTVASCWRADEVERGRKETERVRKEIEREMKETEMEDIEREGIEEYMAWRSDWLD